MAHFLPYLVGGFTAFMAMDYMQPAAPVAGAGVAPWSATAPVSGAVRASKTDRIAPARPSDSRPSIAQVEVVGLDNAAVVYRDREGRELFRTDPVSNVTIVSKNVLLPEVTIRQNSSSAVKPVPVEKPVEARDAKDAPGRKVPVGCEPSFSPVAAPSMAHHTGRCVADLGGSYQVASLAN